MSEAALSAGTWLENRIQELRHDPAYQAKLKRVRDGVFEGTFQGRVTTRDDLDRLADDI